MIKFIEMSWDYAFSYGASNRIDFTSSPLVQLVGRNGNGKSSIPLILEECLFNKNSKSIKKANILNRYAKAKAYSIEVVFQKDSDLYKVSTVRGSTQSVKLTKNGVDISAHTSTATYKLIEEIIGYDHNTFTQIVYQSDPFSLKFLTDTDTARKKFLIGLLSLDVYTSIADKIKAEVKSVSQQVETLNIKKSTYDQWIQKFASEDLSLKDLVEVPSAPVELVAQLGAVESDLRTLDVDNAKIVQNQKYKEILDSITLDIAPAPTQDISAVKLEKLDLERRSTKLNAVISGEKALSGKCHSCGQNIDITHKIEIINSAKLELADVVSKLKEVSKNLLQLEAQKLEYDKSVANIVNWEKYSALYNKALPSTTKDEKDLKKKVLELKTAIDRVNREITIATAHNSSVEAHNAKVAVLLQQKSQVESDLEIVVNKLRLVNTRLDTLNLLAKVFSPSGFIAYKIDYLVKDLEVLVNKYLADMSGGRFQLGFKVTSSDKLDVVITDNGQDIDIEALSNGELARVNISTLLAIRSLLQSISNTRTNLLVLDETIESLDDDGKEKLVEVLLKEPHLNTVLISHGFTHPLVDKIAVIKEKNISRIE